MPKEIPRCFTFLLKSSGTAKIPASNVGKEFHFNSNFYLMSVLVSSSVLAKIPKTDNCNFSTTNPCTKALNQGTSFVQQTKLTRLYQMCKILVNQGISGNSNKPGYSNSQETARI